MAGKLGRRERIKLGVRKKITGTASRPRLSVFRSNTAVSAQLIDDTKGVTLVSVTTRELGAKASGNQENCKTAGKKIAERAIAAGVKDVVFDRNGYLYHGKVKAFAEGAREGGLNF
ncbi:MAG: 50S ribosomal protein L18 [Cyclobacteriaceae bacterium]|jgi:large subunit ribosomal protein L18|nr:50S ribosomal protein L18 [Cytophagales bacterium]MCZ8328685.1 50S ribosomal protein L18 [Cyclobacteriaceae bacterium]